MKRKVSGMRCVAAAALALALAPRLTAQEITAWITARDRSALVQKQERTIAFTERTAANAVAITVDPRQRFQSVDGFGFALTGGSAMHLTRMSPQVRANILREMFATDGTGAGFSYIRLTKGASDLNETVYFYDDLPEGESDAGLENFSLSKDLDDVVPVMLEILAVNPSIKILASPWSAPLWMKDNGAAKGGRLKKECYEVYARYFVRYVEEMARLGIVIDAVTPQNEPLNTNNTPSMAFSPQEQQEFVRDHLGPMLRGAGLQTKIVIFDHNADRIDYPLAILNDPEAARYVDGSGFHHYGGVMSALGQLHTARPDKNIYFTEQMIVEPTGSTTIDIAPQVRRMVVDVMRAWSRNVILWNLAADPLNDPHTDNGGCSMCQGALTIDGDNVTRNLAYYVIAQVSGFVPDGSVRIFSTDTGDPAITMVEDEQNRGIFKINYVERSGVLPNVAFMTPDGNIVLVVVNNTSSNARVPVRYNGRSANLQLASGSVGTFVWKSGIDQ